MMRPAFAFTSATLTLLAVACSTNSSPAPAASPDASLNAIPAEASVPHAPSKHRPAAVACPSHPAGATEAGPGPTDACLTDADCGEGMACMCAEDIAGQIPRPHGAVNQCASAHCSTDADCGSGGFCSPSSIFTTCAPSLGFYCHTASDTCEDNTDCVSLGTNDCAWMGSRWACGYVGCAG